MCDSRGIAISLADGLPGNPGQLDIGGIDGNTGGNPDMRRCFTWLAGALVIALVVAACARRSDLPLSNLGEDDDAICRANNVAPGSPAYVACIKDRDAQRANAASRADQRQHGLAQDMLDHPYHP